MAFETIVNAMLEMTAFQLFFPWLLVLAITYGILDKYGTISEEDSVNAVISLAVAFMAIGGSLLFIPEGMLAHLVAGLTFGLFAVIGLLIVMAAGGYNLEHLEDSDRPLPTILGLAIFLITIIAVSITYIEIPESLTSLLDVVDEPYEVFNEIVMPILILAFMFGIVALTMIGGSSEGE